VEDRCGIADNSLVAAVLCDRLSDGISLVYSFFEPDHFARSLGTYIVLEQIEFARRMGLPFVYLGYWISGSRKMDYKTKFMPQEHLTQQGWRRADPSMMAVRVPVRAAKPGSR
jgi:arginine-tRNA-protein transferase